MELQKIFLIFLVAQLALTSSERLFHSRDRSDIQARAQNKAESILTREGAQNYLQKYGWIEPVHWDSMPFRGVPATSEENVAPPDISILLNEGESSPSTLPVTAPHPKPTLNPRFIGALRRFQEANGLRVTGELDEATREAMNAPRCGVPDQKVTQLEKSKDSDNLSNEEGHPTHVAQTAPTVSDAKSNGRLALSQHVRKKRSHLLKAGKKKGAFSKPTIKWRLLGEGYSIWLSINQQRSILSRAFRMWSEVVPLNFEEDTDSPAHLIDIKLGFGTRRHLGCSQLFDGMGREFAHAWQLGDIHFDDDEHFVPPNSDQGISLLKVASHEIGHVLGLSHMNEASSVMQPSYIPANSRMELDVVDRKAIQRIYGRCSGPFNTIFDWVHQERGSLVFHTYFFRKSWYWKYENRNNRTRYRDPRRLANGWKGIPSSDIDGFLHIWTQNLTCFFKGTQYWRYDNENDRAYIADPEKIAYPRLISDGFPGINGPIDTAFYDIRDNNIYFFQGRNVTAFSVAQHKVLLGYPKSISEVFPPWISGDHPLSDLDAAYYSFTHETVFFIKETNVWRMAGHKGPQDIPPNSLLPRQLINELWLDICDVHPTMLTVPRR
ncbi:matrix metalloproteinase-21-like [Hyperolius riggenbachi]|uniref:matrix metalloproteinase-21-like n=1 Tax=Hyperolius riggenbachi TaxID=752182 RepID=UPI0035A2A464